MATTYVKYPANTVTSVPTSAFPLLAPNGTVAAPSYSFGGGTGGAGTGLYAPGANSAAISTNGTQGFRLSSTQTATIGSDNSTTHILIGGESTITGSSLNCKVATTDAAGSFAITRFGNDGLLVLSGGGSSNGNDAMIRLYGNTHATKASLTEIYSVGVIALSIDANAKVSMPLAMATRRLNVASTATIASLSSASSFVKLTGSTATDLQGIAAGVDGQNLRLWNATGQTLTIRNASASAASGAKITTCTGADITTTGNGFAEFIYDTDASPAVWVCSYVTT